MISPHTSALTQQDLIYDNECREKDYGYLQCIGCHLDNQSKGKIFVFKIDPEYLLWGKNNGHSFCNINTVATKILQKKLFPAILPQDLDGLPLYFLERYSLFTQSSSNQVRVDVFGALGYKLEVKKNFYYYGGIYDYSTLQIHLPDAKALNYRIDQFAKEHFKLFNVTHSQGIADAGDFITSLVQRRYLISEQMEFTHDHLIHMIPLIKNTLDAACSPDLFSVYQTTLNEIEEDFMQAKKNIALLKEISNEDRYQGIVESLEVLVSMLADVVLAGNYHVYNRAFRPKALGQMLISEEWHPYIEKNFDPEILELLKTEPIKKIRDLIFDQSLEKVLQEFKTSLIALNILRPEMSLYQQIVQLSNDFIFELSGYEVVS